jgi:hypothetical protein
MPASLDDLSLATRTVNASQPLEPCLEATNERGSVVHARPAEYYSQQTDIFARICRGFFRDFHGFKKPLAGSLCQPLDIAPSANFPLSM